VTDPTSRGRLIEFTPLRSAIGRQMAESKRQAPHFYVSAELNLGPGLETLEELNRGREERITVTALLVRSVSSALRMHPSLNAVWTPEGLSEMPEVNLGVAIAVPGGVIAPALMNSASLGLHETHAALVDLVSRARAGKLRSSEMTGATCTLSNLGMFDVTQFTAIITPPQVAIVAVGRIAGYLATTATGSSRVQWRWAR
jgi:pyruvate dehydrogenase E2 component (dihydrolipoamide acetyltransferase)